MAKYAEDLLKVAKGWVGCKESNGSHKKIIDVYNNHKPLARGYAVKYTDEWCATFVSACAIKAGMTDIIPTECSCERMIWLFQALKCWNEKDSYVPAAGDIIFYYWQDSGSGDATGWADHVGIVESCDGKKIIVIEGNKNESVSRRTIKVNGKYIRGFAVPKYDKKKPANEPKPVEKVTKKETATDYAKSFNATLAGTYKVTAESGLHLRSGAGTSKRSMVVLPKGTKVQNYGYYTLASGITWLYIQTTLNGVQYTGFSCRDYLKK